MDDATVTVELDFKQGFREGFLQGFMAGYMGNNGCGCPEEE